MVSLLLKLSFWNIFEDNKFMIDKKLTLLCALSLAAGRTLNKHVVF